jgi:hypothetical protein
MRTCGLVVFDEFSRDWLRKKSAWQLENGWNFWYSDHQDLEGLRVDLICFRRGVFEAYPL